MAVITQSDYNKNRRRLSMNPSRDRQQDQQQQAQTPAARKQAEQQARADRAKPKPALPAALSTHPAITAPTAAPVPDFLQTGTTHGTLPLPAALQRPPQPSAPAPQTSAQPQQAARAPQGAPAFPPPSSLLQRPTTRRVDVNAPRVQPTQDEVLNLAGQLNERGGLNPRQAIERSQREFTSPQIQGTRQDTADAQHRTQIARDARLGTTQVLDASQQGAGALGRQIQSMGGDVRFDLGVPPELLQRANRLNGSRNLAFGGTPIGQTQLPAALQRPADPERVAFAQQQLAEAEANPQPVESFFTPEQLERGRARLAQEIEAEQQQQQRINTANIIAAAERGDPRSQAMASQILAEQEQARRLEQIAALPRELQRPRSPYINVGGRAFNTETGEYLTAPDDGRGSREPMGRDRYLRAEDGTFFDTLTRRFVSAADQPQPLPADPGQITPDMLQDGSVYQTPRGPARWDATNGQFIPVEQ